MTPEERLAQVATALGAAGVKYLVLGGHAVRFYGLYRVTSDFDLQVAADQFDDLPARLTDAGLVPAGTAAEGPSWRAGVFRRFRIGALPDGRDEWLEFWKENHILPQYDVLAPRAVRGEYGGRPMSFLSLPDLIRSKETERDADWPDVCVLEQFHDARFLALLRNGLRSVPEALAPLRSRAGFEGYLAEGVMTAGGVSAALHTATHPVTQAFLLPLAPAASAATPVMLIEPVILQRLTATTPVSPLPLSLVEIVRRRYVAFRKDLTGPMSG